MTQTANDVNLVIAQARKAFAQWSLQELSMRLQALDRVRERLILLREQLIASVHSETGKPQTWAAAEVDFCIGSFSAHNGEFQTSFSPERIEDETGASEIFFRPLGVVVVFSPYNSPLECLQLGLLPALAAGNSVIIKTSEYALDSVEMFVAAFQSELGREVVQVVHGGGDVGANLVRGEIDMVVFTGSEATGRKIAAEAGGGLKRVILELGGKDPFIILHDADLNAAVDAAVVGAFGFSGQVCTASEQVWVEKSLYPRFLELAQEKLSKLEASSLCPPLISKESCHRVMSLINDAVAKGAHVVCGGNSSNVGDKWFVEPTILTGVTAEMRLAHEEIFGPVMCVQAFSGDAEVVQSLARARYALGATIHTRDIERAKGLARRLPNAVVGINRSCIGVQGTPWLGARSSGLGFLGSIDGHRQFCSRQVITV
jgi:acyl-CoA reductase-like NAD-dependent aldehyde dehydrogenase